MQDDQAPAAETYRFDVERRVENVFETYTGWLLVATVEAEYERAALEKVLADCEAQGRYRIIRHNPSGYRSLTDYTVTRRMEWDIERLEDVAPAEAAA
jgi:hypothetical protein